MEKKTLMAMGIAIVAFAAVIILLQALGQPGGQRAKPAVQQEQQTAAQQPTAGATRTSQGTVTVEITPAGFSSGQLMFTIGVNTHSVALEQYDLKELTTLSYGGRSIQPESAPQLNGHHNSGSLTFLVPEEPKQFKVVIRGLPDIDERVFEWP